MVKLITVHGTNAGRDADEGEQWWQHGSFFQKRLAALLDFEGAGVQWVPFHWKNGPNSELERRAAGQRLLSQLLDYEKAGERYFVIGHSHGGSVVHHALLWAATWNRELAGLARWVTIGTPFIVWAEPGWWWRSLYLRMSGFRRIVASVVLSLVLVLWTIFAPFVLLGGDHAPLAGMNDSLARAGQLGSGLVASPLVDTLYIVAKWLALAGVVVCATYAVFRPVWWLAARMYLHDKRTPKRFADLFDDRLICLRSKSDEAIHALEAIKGLHARIFKSNMIAEILQSPQACLIVVAILVIVLGVILPRYVVSVNEPIAHVTMFMASSSDPLAGMLSPKVRSIGAVILGPLLCGIGFTVVLLATFFGSFGSLWLIGYGAGYLLSRFLNRITSAGLRNVAYGADVFGEHVGQIESLPPESARRGIYGPLPDAVDDALSAFSNQHAAETLSRARNVLGLTRQVGKDPDVLSAITEQLSWNELIHTAYFQVEEFIRILAYGLHEAGLAPLRKAGWTNDEIAQAAAWQETLAAKT